MAGKDRKRDILFVKQKGKYRTEGKEICRQAKF